MSIIVHQHVYPHHPSKPAKNTSRWSPRYESRLKFEPQKLSREIVRVGNHMLPKGCSQNRSRNWRRWYILRLVEVLVAGVQDCFHPWPNEAEIARWHGGTYRKTSQMRNWKNWKTSISKSHPIWIGNAPSVNLIQSLQIVPLGWMHCAVSWGLLLRTPSPNLTDQILVWWFQKRCSFLETVRKSLHLGLNGLCFSVSSCFLKTFLQLQVHGFPRLGTCTGKIMGEFSIHTWHSTPISEMVGLSGGGFHDYTKVRAKDPCHYFLYCFAVILFQKNESAAILPSEFNFLVIYQSQKPGCLLTLKGQWGTQSPWFFPAKVWKIFVGCHCECSHRTAFGKGSFWK